LLAIHVKLSQLQLRRPRQWGACWLALMLWRELQLDQFWPKRLGVSRKGTRWDQVLFVLVAYRLLAPGSEWRLHREWFRRSALADLLGEDAGLAETHKLYRCHDRLLTHKQAVFDHLVGRWRDLFNISYDVLLYELTSNYFEADPPFPEGDKRRFGYSRDYRPDCVQIIIALVVTPEGLPLAYEVLPGNTADTWGTGRRQRLARGRHGFANPVQVAASSGVCGLGREQPADSNRRGFRDGPVLRSRQGQRGLDLFQYPRQHDGER
jgi:hypothetical protein